jgi:hypothetical protein
MYLEVFFKKARYFQIYNPNQNMKQILRNYFILLFFLFATSLQGQEWTRLYTDTAVNTFTRIIKSIPHNNGYTFLGMTVGKLGNVVLLVGHTQVDGQIKWQKRLEEGVAQEPFFITADIRNELAVVNAFFEDLNYQLDFIKLSTTGQLKLAKTIIKIDTVNLSEKSEKSFFKISQFIAVEDSNYLVSLTGKNPKLLKLNARGDTLWTRNYSDITANLTHDGHIIAFNIQTSEFAKLNVKTGVIIWTKKLDPFDITISEFYKFSLFNTTDKGIIISRHTGEDEVKFDENGSFIWRVPALNKVAYANAPTKDGGFVKIYPVYLSLPIEYNIIKYDKNGFIEWDKLLFTNTPLSTRTKITDIFQTNDGGYLISGTYDDLSLGVKGRLIKTSANGNMVTRLDEQRPSLSKINIAPNPFSDLTTIEIENLPVPILEKNYRFKLFDATGRLLKIDNFNHDKLTFSRNNLSTGLYFFTVENDKEVIGNGKIAVSQN